MSICETVALLRLRAEMVAQLELARSRGWISQEDMDAICEALACDRPVRPHWDRVLKKFRAAGH